MYKIIVNLILVVLVVGCSSKTKDDLNALDKTNKRQKFYNSEIELKELMLCVDIVIKDSIAFCSEENNGISIIDLDNLEKPLLVSKIELPGKVYSTHIEGNLLYAAQGDYYSEGISGLVTIIDIENYKYPKVIKSINFEREVYDLVVEDKVLYIPTKKKWPDDDANGILYVYNVNDVSNIKLLSKIEFEDHEGHHIEKVRDLVFLSNYNRNMTIYNLSNINKPVLLSKHDVKIDWVSNLIKYNDKLIISHGAEEVDVLSYSPEFNINRYSMTFFKNKNHLRHNKFAFAIKDNILFRADGKEGVYVIDISLNENYMIIKKLIFKDEHINFLLIVHNSIIIGNSGRKIHIYKIKDILQNYIGR